MTARRPARTLRGAGRSGWTPCRRAITHPGTVSRVARGQRFTINDMTGSFNFGMTIGEIHYQGKFRAFLAEVDAAAAEAEADAGMDAFQDRLWQAYMTGHREGLVGDRYTYLVDALLDREKARALGEIEPAKRRAVRADLMNLVGDIAELVHDLTVEPNREHLTREEWPELDEEGE